MNIDVSRQRYKDVFLKNLLLLDHSEPTDNDKKHPLTEESIY